MVDGERFLAVSSVRIYELRLLDLGDGQVVFNTKRYPYDLSADGQWLLFAEDGGLRAYAPGIDYEWILEHDLPHCHAAVWII